MSNATDRKDNPVYRAALDDVRLAIWATLRDPRMRSQISMPFSDLAQMKNFLEMKDITLTNQQIEDLAGKSQEILARAYPEIAIPEMEKIAGVLKEVAGENGIMLGAVYPLPKAQYPASKPSDGEYVEVFNKARNILRAHVIFGNFAKTEDKALATMQKVLNDNNIAISGIRVGALADDNVACDKISIPMDTLRAIPAVLTEQKIRAFIEAETNAEENSLPQISAKPSGKYYSPAVLRRTDDFIELVDKCRALLREHVQQGPQDQKRMFPSKVSLQRALEKERIYVSAATLSRLRGIDDCPHFLYPKVDAETVQRICDYFNGSKNSIKADISAQDNFNDAGQGTVSRKQVINDAPSKTAIPVAPMARHS